SLVEVVQKPASRASYIQHRATGAKLSKQSQLALKSNRSVITLQLRWRQVIIRAALVIILSGNKFNRNGIGIEHRAGATFGDAKLCLLEPSLGLDRTANGTWARFCFARHGNGPGMQPATPIASSRTEGISLTPRFSGVNRRVTNHGTVLTVSLRPHK